MSTPPKQPNTWLMPCLRVVGGLCGAAVVALGIYSISESGDLRNIVANVYRIIFGLLVIIAEFRMVFLLQWFSFLTFFSGLGAFYIFIGGLALGSEWYEIALAITMCAMGFIYLGSACVCSEYAHQHQEETAKKVMRNESTETSDSSVHGHDAGASTSPYREMEDGDSRRTKLNDNPFGDSDAGGYAGGYGGTKQDVNDPFGGQQRSAYGY